MKPEDEKKEKIWTTIDENVLRDIHAAIAVYIDSFYHYNDYLRRLSIRYRIPIIIFSALSSGASFINIGIFSTKTQKGINIGVGSISLLVTILTAIEGYLKLPILTNQTDKVLLELGKISHSLYGLISIEPHLRGEPKDVINNTFNQLGMALSSSPVIPASQLSKIKIRMKKNSMYSLFRPPRYRSYMMHDKCTSTGESSSNDVYTTPDTHIESQSEGFFRIKKSIHNVCKKMDV